MYIEKKEKQLRDVVVESYQECDKCKKRIEEESFKVHDFELEFSTGISYPEHREGTTAQMHLCVPCSVDCLNLLIENGYRINTEEWDH